MPLEPTADAHGSAAGRWQNQFENRIMIDSNFTRQRVRRLWLIWCLLPFPLANSLILPCGLLFAYYEILPGFLVVHFSPETVLAFPNPEQIQAYGLESYKALLSRGMLSVVLSSGCWLGNLVIHFKTLIKIENERQDKIKWKTLLLSGVGQTTLSLLSGVLLILAIGMIG